MILLYKGVPLFDGRKKTLLSNKNEKMHTTEISQGMTDNPEYDGKK